MYYNCSKGILPEWNLPALKWKQASWLWLLVFLIALAHIFLIEFSQQAHKGVTMITYKGNGGLPWLHSGALGRRSNPEPMGIATATHYLHSTFSCGHFKLDLWKAQEIWRVLAMVIFQVGTNMDGYELWQKIPVGYEEGLAVKSESPLLGAGNACCN